MGFQAKKRLRLGMAHASRLRFWRRLRACVRAFLASGLPAFGLVAFRPAFSGLPWRLAFVPSGGLPCLPSGGGCHIDIVHLGGPFLVLPWRLLSLRLPLAFRIGQHWPFPWPLAAFVHASGISIRAAYGNGL